jgi:hypothetical protein
MAHISGKDTMHQKTGTSLTCNGWWDDNCNSFVPNFNGCNEVIFKIKSKIYIYKSYKKIGKGRISSNMCLGEKCSKLQKKKRNVLKKYVHNCKVCKFFPATLFKLYNHLIS